MEIPGQLLPENVSPAHVRAVLETVPCHDASEAVRCLHALREKGMDPQAARKVITWWYASQKYGAPPSPDTLETVLVRAFRGPRYEQVSELFDDPVFAVKCCWLFEHAPFYLYGNERDGSRRRALVADFARRYRALATQTDRGVPIPSPGHDLRRVFASTIWDSSFYDPVKWIRKAAADGIQGVELAVDFHPFNPVRALPAEIGAVQRRRLRGACRQTGVRVDLHAPFVGPNRPSPDPKLGKPAFSHPASNPWVYRDTVDLAREIGGGAVVVHLIEPDDVPFFAELAEYAAGSPVRVTMENYCMTEHRQDAEMFLACAEEVRRMLPAVVRNANFGVTMDLGHFNIEGEDPFRAAYRVGRWCRDNSVSLRVHATDNYGMSLFREPAHSPGLHGNVSGRGIDSALIVQMLRSMELVFDVVAEQSHPLTLRDIQTVHDAQTLPLAKDYAGYDAQGVLRLQESPWLEFIDEDKRNTEPYRFLAGLRGPQELAEYLLHRRIQSPRTLSVDEADRIYRQFMRMPSARKGDLADYVDELLTLMRHQMGDLSKKDVDSICQNISGALFGTISNEHLQQIFSKERSFQKGQTICRQKSPGREMYYVKSGQVLVYIDQLCVAALSPGEIAGEMSLFYNIRRSATLVALEDDTRVGVLDRSDLELLFKSGNPYADDLIYRFFKTLPGRLRNINERYKAAIHNLHLLSAGDPKAMPNLDYEPMDAAAASSQFFPKMSDEDIRGITAGRREYRAGELVFQEGDEGVEAFFLLEGSVRVYARPAGGPEIQFGTLKKGDLFGEMALIDDRPRSASVQALSPTRVAVIEKAAFGTFIEERTPMAVQMMGFINLALFRRILRLDRIYSDLKKAFVMAPKKRSRRRETTTQESTVR